MTTTDAPQVWIGCLACYNDGSLTGEWVDAIDAGDLTTEELHTHQNVTVNPVYGPHEELWVMDHQDFHGLLTGECSPCEAQRIAEAMEAFERNGGDVKALGAYKGYTGLDLDEAIHSFFDHYEGEWDSEKDFAYHWAEDVLNFEADNDGPGSYIDWDRYATSLFKTFSMVDGYVFSC